MVDKIFTEEEKEYLEETIKDWEKKKEKAKYIKFKYVQKLGDCIQMHMLSGACLVIYNKLSCGTFSKLHLNKEYTLDELGLFKE